MVMPLKRYSIGRALDCDVVLADASVSRRHAELEVGDNRLTTLVDCQSTQGTHVVEGGKTRRIAREAVRPETQIRIGDLTLTVADLLEAIRVRQPSPPPVAPGPPQPSPVSRDLPSAPGTRRLVRCGCGVIKTKGSICPGCGQ